MGKKFFGPKGLTRYQRIKKMKSKKISVVRIKRPMHMEWANDFEVYVMRRGQLGWVFPSSVYEHEKKRWEEMTEEQLATRVKKITKEEKLQCFKYFAELAGNKHLLDLAERREKSLELRRRIEDGYTEQERRRAIGRQLRRVIK